MYRISIILLIVTLAFADNFSFRVTNFEAKSFNIMQEIVIEETPIIQIDINTDEYITFRGMFNGKQVGRTLTILSTVNDKLEYHFICKDTKTGSIHSITLDLFKKLIVLDNDNDFIEVYGLELL